MALAETSTPLQGWLVRKVQRKFKVRRKANSVGIALQEVYLRDDISCGSSLCTKCAHISPPRLPADVSHYLIPDVDALLNFWEVLDLPHVRGVIYLASVLSEVQARSSQRNWRHLRSLFSDKRRQNAYYDDKHSLFMSIQSRQLLKEGIECAGAWFCQHLEGKIPIIVMSGCLSSSENPQGYDLGKDFAVNYDGTLKVLNAASYFDQFWSHDSAVMELYNSLVQARIELGVHNDDTTTNEDSRGLNNRDINYQEHLTGKAIELGVASGDLRIGVFHSSKYSPDEAFVRPSNKGEASLLEILIPGRRLQNRALQGDIVAVRVFSSKTFDKTNKVLEQESIFGDTRNLAHEDVARIAKTLNYIEEDEAVNNGDQTVVASQDIIHGEVVGIVQRVQKEYVACLDESEEAATSLLNPNRQENLLCVPMDQRIPLVRVASRQRSQLIGQRFVIRIDGWNLTSRIPRGHVIRILGPIGDINAENTALLIENEINISPFSTASLQELPVDTAEHPWVIPEEEITKRRDLRSSHKPFSVDPPGCRDVDDALSVYQLPNNLLEVGVHIADVSYFVKEDTQLDLEAFTRATTVYLVGTAYHMLPSILSENLCSLREGQDRFAVSVIWTVDPENDFEVLETWFGRTIIRSCSQLSYAQAQAILDGETSYELENDGEPKTISSLRANLCQIAAFAQIRRVFRESNGALELASAELAFETEDGREPLNVKTKKGLPMNWIVAEMMIFANSCVASKIYKAFPRAALLRSHRSPKLDNFHMLLQLCEALGVSVDVSSNKALADFLTSLRNSATPGIESAFKALLTRAMSEAQYISTGDVPDSSGFYHYGLALEFYTHFTSPIRRYADILVHRMLVAACSNVDRCEKFERKGYDFFRKARHPALTAETLSEVADHLNQRNRASKRAQKQCSELHLLKYLEKHGEAQYALVLEIVEKGMFIFVPKYDLRGFINIKDKNGNVILPLEKDDQATDSDDKSNSKSQKYMLRYESSRITILNKDGNSLYEFKRMSHVWVYLKAHGSRARLPSLSIQLLSEKHPASLAARAQYCGIDSSHSFPSAKKGTAFRNAHTGKLDEKLERKKTIHKMAGLVSNKGTLDDLPSVNAENINQIYEKATIYEAVGDMEQHFYNVISVFAHSETLPSTLDQPVNANVDTPLCGSSSLDLLMSNLWIPSENEQELSLRKMWQKTAFQAADIRSRYLRSASNNLESRQKNRISKEIQNRQRMQKLRQYVGSVSC